MPAIPKHSAHQAGLLAARARNMRFAPTSSEAKLWQEIRGRRLGATFRRQVPIGRYVVDFLAPKERLVVEVDGGYHQLRAQADSRRDRDLERSGYRVLRLGAELVERELVVALGRIRDAIARPRG